MEVRSIRRGARRTWGVRDFHPALMNISGRTPLGGAEHFAKKN